LETASTACTTVLGLAFVFIFFVFKVIQIDFYYAISTKIIVPDIRHTDYQRVNMVTVI
jgi:accessory gene regulator protein AgrB